MKCANALRLFFPVKLHVVNLFRGLGKTDKQIAASETGAPAMKRPRWQGDYLSHPSIQNWLMPWRVMAAREYGVCLGVLSTL